MSSLLNQALLFSACFSSTTHGMVLGCFLMKLLRSVASEVILISFFWYCMLRSTLWSFFLLLAFVFTTGCIGEHQDTRSPGGTFSMIPIETISSSLSLQGCLMWNGTLYGALCLGCAFGNNSMLTSVLGMHPVRSSKSEGNLCRISFSVNGT